MVKLHQGKAVAGDCLPQVSTGSSPEVHHRRLLVSPVETSNHSLEATSHSTSLPSPNMLHSSIICLHLTFVLNAGVFFFFDIFSPDFSL